MVSHFLKLMRGRVHEHKSIVFEVYNDGTMKT